MKNRTKRILGENIIKNLFVLTITVLAYPIISNSLATVNKGGVSDLLIVISILLVFVGFTGFSFTYEKVNLTSTGERVLAHSVTFIALLLTALLLEIMAIIVKLAYPSFYALILILSLLLYLSVVLYDFWDLLKVKH